MPKALSLGLPTLALGLSMVPAFASPGLITGDSLGVGVSMASHLRSFAKNSVSIRAGGLAIQQIEQAPPGSVVFLSLGTNDAVASIDGLQGGIERIVQAAAKAQVHLVWIGPPCVFKPWDKNAVALDGILQQSLHGTEVTYVSMRSDKLCDRTVRAPDGVHFNMTGYHYMWDKAREAAGFVAEAGSVAAVEPNHVKATQHKAKKKRRKRKPHRTLSPDVTPAAPVGVAPAAAPPQSPPQ